MPMTDPVLNLFNSIIIAIEIAMASFIYCVVLTEPDMLLAGWYKFLLKSARNCRKPSDQVWWFKILIGCEKCNTGQLALWLFLFYAWKNQMYQIDFAATALLHLFTISFSMFTTIIIGRIYRWTQQS